MTHDKDHAPSIPAHETKSPETLPGPNREAEITRVGEALAPGTVPDEERQERERRGQRGNTPGLDKP
ncbi:MAG: hypothetical protein ACM3NQ_24245 [Bacteroidales bacterium]